MHISVEHIRYTHTIYSSDTRGNLHVRVKRFYTHPCFPMIDKTYYDLIMLYTSYVGATSPSGVSLLIADIMYVRGNATMVVV